MKKMVNYFSQFELVRLKRGQVLLNPDEQISHIYFLEKGYVKQYVISEDGEEITIHIFRNPSYFPMMLAIAGVSNKYFFEALGSVEARKAPLEQTMEFVKNNPEALFDLTKRFAGGINGLAIRLENLVSERSYKRVVSFFLYLANTFGENRRGKVEIKLPLTHKEIASWVNLTRETTSRQIEKLINKQLLTRSKLFFIVNDTKELANQLKNPYLS